MSEPLPACGSHSEPNLWCIKIQCLHHNSLLANHLLVLQVSPAEPLDNAAVHCSPPLPCLQVLAYPMTLDLVVLADAVAVLHGAESSPLLSGFQALGSQAISSHARIAEVAL